MDAARAIRIGDASSGAVVEVLGVAAPWSRQVVLSARSGAFEGSARDTLDADDLEAFADQLERADAPRTAALGSGRSAALRIEIAPTRPVSGELSLQIELTRSDDDPWPRLALLAAATPESLREAAAALRAAVRDA